MATSPQQKKQTEKKIKFFLKRRKGLCRALPIWRSAKNTLSSARSGALGKGATSAFHCIQASAKNKKSHTLLTTVPPRPAHTTCPRPAPPPSAVAAPAPTLPRPLPPASAPTLPRPRPPRSCLGHAGAVPSRPLPPAPARPRLGHARARAAPSRPRPPAPVPATPATTARPCPR